MIGIHSTGWQALTRWRLSSRTNENCGDANLSHVFEGLVDADPQHFRLRQVKTAVKYKADGARVKGYSVD